MERLYSTGTLQFALGFRYAFRRARSRGLFVATKKNGVLGSTLEDVSVWLARTGRIRQVDHWVLRRLLDIAADQEVQTQHTGKGFHNGQHMLDKETGHDYRYNSSTSQIATSHIEPALRYG